MKALILLIFICTSLCSCNKFNESSYLNKGCKTISEFKTDSITNTWTNAFIENNKYLTLYNFNVPSDTFFLRIETSIRKKREVKIFEYSFYNSKSSFKIYRFPFEKSGKILFDKEKDNLKNYKTTFDSNEIGKSFTAQLKQNRILELPSPKEIPDYPDEDGYSGVLISYSNKCKFKIVFYNDPESFSKYFKEAQSVVNFLAYLKQEFKF